MPVETYPDYRRLRGLGENFLGSQVLFVADFVSVDFCREATDQLTEDYLPIPADGGDVYEFYNGQLPSSLSSTADNLSKIIGMYARPEGFVLDRKIPSKHEVVRYKDSRALSLHRDNKGFSRTKCSLTLSGSADFHTNEGEFHVTPGDLLILRGIDIVDTLSPEHATSNNKNRHVLLIEPNYLSTE